MLSKCSSRIIIKIITITITTTITIARTCPSVEQMLFIFQLLAVHLLGGLGFGVWGLGFWVLGLGFVGHARGEEFVAAVEGVRVCASKVAVGV